MKNITIRFKLISATVIFAIILISIGVFTYFKLKEIQHIHKLSSSSVEIEQLGLKMRKAEKDFMLRSVTDNMYYQTKTSKYLSDFDNLLENVHSEIEILLNDDLIKEMRLQT